MVKDQEFLEKKASYCLDLAKKLGASQSSVLVMNSISENVNENTIEVYIARIRKLINTSSVIIKTLRGIGYKLEKKNETSF